MTRSSPPNARAALPAMLVAVIGSVAARAQDPATVKPDEPPATTTQEPTTPQAEPVELVDDTAEPLDDATKPDTRALERTYPLHGTLSTRFRMRRTPSADDSDAYVALFLEGGDASLDDWTFRVDAQAIADVDGAERSTSPFFSLEDAQGGAFHGYVYEAYGERHRLGAFDSIRVGRQTEVETPVFLWFDGVSARTRSFGSSRATFGACAGRSVRQFEPSGGDERLFGAFASVRPWRRARVRLDWAHVEDPERTGGEGDDLVQLALGQGIGEHLQLDASVSRLEDATRDASLRATWIDAERDLVVRASWYGSFETQSTQVLELDPFTSALLELFPYQQGRFAVSKGFGDHVRADVGAELRRVIDDDDEGLFNHDYERAYATLALAKLPLDLDVSLTGEDWNASGNDVSTWSAELGRTSERERGDRGRIALGTAYWLYRFDLFQLDEREDVRAWYLRWREQRRAGLGWDLRYEYEDDPGEDLQTLRVGATWSF